MKSKISESARSIELKALRACEIITEQNLEKVYKIKVKVVNVDVGVSRKICVPIGE